LGCVLYIGLLFQLFNQLTFQLGEMQQLAHATAFLTAVMPPIYLTSRKTDVGCIVGLWYVPSNSRPAAQLPWVLAHGAIVAATVAETGWRDNRTDSFFDRRLNARPVHTRHNRPTYRIKFHQTAAWLNHVRMQTGWASAIRQTDHCSVVVLHCGLEQQPAELKQTGLVCEIQEMRIIHRIINFCITTTPKTEGAYYTQVRIISETLRYIYLTTFTTVLADFTSCSTFIDTVIIKQTTFR